MVSLERSFVERSESGVVLVHRSHARHVKSICNHVWVTHLARSVEDRLAGVLVHHPPAFCMNMVVKIYVCGVSTCCFRQ